MAATGHWVPNADAMAQLLQLVRDSCTADNTQHQAIYRRFEELKKHAEFSNYLSRIMSSTEVGDDVRARAGLMLKNNIRENYANTSAVGLDYIQAEAMTSLADASAAIRRTAGTVLATIAIKGPKSNLCPMILSICSIIKSPQNAGALDGALGALSKIVEDATDDVVRIEELGDHEAGVIAQMVALLVQLLSHSQEALRCMALATLNRFLVNMPKALFMRLDAYLGVLFQLTRDPSPDIRRQICQALCILLEVRYGVLKDSLAQVVEFMVGASADPDSSVSIEANEFWNVYCSADEYDFPLLFPFLNRIVPTLMNGMLYSDDDPILLSCVQIDNEHVPDRPEDIKPRFHNPRGSMQDVAGHMAGTVDSDDSLSDDDDDASEWNLRKCSASALDKLSTRFQTNLLLILFPLLQANLGNLHDWRVRECGVLSLGAIAEGCLAGLEPHLPQLIPYLIQLMSHDPHPLVRSICCWTLSRFARCIVRSAPMFESALHAVLARILDRNKKVQEAACSAFAILTEEAGPAVVAYLAPIVQNLIFAFDKYQTKNRLLLYDAIGSLADSCGAVLAQQMELVTALLNRIMLQWNATRDDDPSMYPLLECLTYLAQALATQFMPWAPVTFQRALGIIEQCLGAIERASQNPDADYPDKEFVVCGLDLLSGLVEGLKSGAVALIGPNDQRLLKCLFQCSRDPSPEIRQSAVALLGDLSKYAMPVLRPHLDQFMQMILANLDGSHVAVCNNASWAIGEIAHSLPPAELAPSVGTILARIVPILTAPRITARLAENLSITIARLGSACPVEVGAQLDRFILAWCYHLGHYREDPEKVNAFKGMMAVCQANPQAVLGAFAQFCAAIASWRQAPPDLVQLFGNMLHGFKASMDETQWTALFQTCAAPVQSSLAALYSL